MQPCLPPRAGIRQVLIVILDVHLNCRSDLLHVRKAARRARLFAGLGEDREKNRGQDGDDGNDDEKLDQRERSYYPDALSHFVLQTSTGELCRSSSREGL